ncbi:zf-HC2 domain-containing protein [Actinomadura fibrosa]|uniref:zf-HC2 domain-containing protein n=1 Tax=Actinomadura fibrosa TaxID=111802 RepID=UPI00104131F3|nr:zf-HC2 domain-containing protein [Actinomadura fibrosa]
MTHAPPDVHALAGAYALDGLPEAERGRFEDHLGECGDCAREVRGLREVAARLGSAAAVPAREATMWSPSGRYSRAIVRACRRRGRW